MSTTEQELFDPNTAGEGARQRRRRRVVRRTGIALVLVVALAAGWYLYAAPVLRPCGEGLFSMDDECMGISDGSVSFDAGLADVENKIAEENRRVANQSAVTVALLMPITLRPVDSPHRQGQNLLSFDQVRSQVEGAYVAQRHANRKHLKIRLVLANEGSRQQAWRPVVDQLKGMTTDPQPLVAVTGLGVSVQETADAARELSASEIPSVSSLISADGMSPDHLRAPYFWQAATNNHNTISALRDYLRERRPDLRSAILVTDTNPTDLYTSNLGEDFQKLFPENLADEGRPSFPYQGTPGSVGIQTQFETITERLCSTRPPDMVFYAGRTALLPEFITQLRERRCANDQPITVATGSDASDLQSALKPPSPTDSPVSVLYAGLAEPKALADPKWNPDLGQRQAYLRFESEFREAGFSSAHLNNGWAIMQHDALSAIATAAQRASGQFNTLPALGDVASFLRLFNEHSAAVQGAAGAFAFTDGVATGRPVPILRLNAGNQVEVLDVRP